ncbi:hypothetical protein M0R45_028141 [Rubus argutus]|uniref:UBC core domain-containing protein n=1 Tax=Rubus argutus TaxID=59490 RepID=A0AAW1W4H0_RUBAR
MDIVASWSLEKALEDALLWKMLEDSPDAVLSGLQERQQVVQRPSLGPEHAFALSRLHREMKALLQDPPAGVSVVPPEDRNQNLMFWNVVLATDTPLPTKPDGSRDLDSNFVRVTLQFDKDYPCKPPTVQCVDRIFHPSILSNGNICLDILQEDHWSPKYDAKDILMAIQSLIGNRPTNS